MQETTLHSALDQLRVQVGRYDLKGTDAGGQGFQYLWIVERRVP